MDKTTTAPLNPTEDTSTNAQDEDWTNLQALLESQTVDAEQTRMSVFERILQHYLDNSTTDLMRDINNFTYKYVTKYGRPKIVPERRYTLVLAMMLHALSSKQYLPLLPELQGMTFEEQNQRLGNTFHTLYSGDHKGLMIDHNDGTLSLLNLQTPQQFDITRLPDAGTVPLTLTYTRVSELPQLLSEFLSPLISL